MVLSFRNLKGKYETRAKYFSQTENSISDTTPKTIMQMGPASAQPLGNDDARLKGSRIKANPAIVKNMPTTMLQKSQSSNLAVANSTVGYSWDSPSNSQK